jgi:hypothetical protein
VNQYGGHLARCVPEWGECICGALWQADEAAWGDDLGFAYGQFYDPDWDSDPLAEPESYGGWSRANRGWYS